MIGLTDRRIGRRNNTKVTKKYEFVIFVVFVLFFEDVVCRRAR
ncbi:MAG: hypothetical protein ABR606_06490 [Vicinamibacterales bacterium]